MNLLVSGPLGIHAYRTCLRSLGDLPNTWRGGTTTLPWTQHLVSSGAVIDLRQVVELAELPYVPESTPVR